MEASFKWANAEITVTRTTVKTRMKINRLRRMINMDAITNEFDSELASVGTFYLGHVDKVIGDAGFTIPNGNADEESIQLFLDGFYDQDEALMARWDNAIVEARAITNNPDLLPPEEIDPNA